MIKRGQIAIFIIVAVLIVGAVVLIIALRGGINIGGVPSELQPVFSLYEECIEMETREGLNLLGLQGGRIETGVYEPGSDYAPLSSHLIAFGHNIPYWYTIRNNGLADENVPTTSSMQ